MQWLPLSPRRFFLLTIDLTLASFSLYCAFLIRFDGIIPSRFEALYFQQLLPTMIFIRCIAFIYCGFYTGLWRYSGIKDLAQIIKATSISSLIILFATFLINRAQIIPRSILIIDFLILMSLLSSTRLAWRLLNEGRNKKPTHKKTNINVLILGANDTGIQLIKHLNQNYPNYSTQGFIDNDSKKIGHTLSGIPVLGGIEDLENIAKKLETKQVLIATPNLSSKTLNDTINSCNKIGIKYKKVASIFDVSSKQIQITKISDFQTSDLLGRDAIPLDLASMENMIRGKRIFVTGAGGSIGSELCHQISSFEPSSLIMLDVGENYLYDLETHLQAYDFRSEYHFLLGSVVDEEKMTSLFRQFKPQLVFHAAAHKHVPLMEKNIDAAIINNIYGTKVIVNLSKQFNVEKFVLVSTDKVVNPSSIMGMTKHIAEKYVHYFSNHSSTQFICVRFGNVLGSNGSVVPLFSKQIMEGGPITITDPNMERYFMLISEAAQLILQATVLGNGGEVFLLEMGKPVKIIDLARKMISLAGYTPEKDIEIKIIGVRKGEKLTEELFGADEKLLTSSHNKINILKSEAPPNPNLLSQVDTLIKNVSHMTPEELRSELVAVVDSGIG